MKLKNGMITDDSNGEFIAVATGEASRYFNGLIRSNSTADYILRKLMTETTKEELLESVLDKYDVDDDTASGDIDKILMQLRELHLLDE
ncbi:MAG: PqqD family protein [Oscillospiraceae bacterium]|nr:PqqD family protein [Oscillospiraceae bacterium]